MLKAGRKVAASGRPKITGRFTQEEDSKLLLLLLVKFLKHNLEQRLKKARVDIGILGFAVLSLLKNGEQTIAILSQKLILAPATLVPAVSALAKKGLIIRQPDPDDRRSHRLIIAPPGLKLLASLPFSSHDDPLIKALAKLPPEEANRFYQSLNYLTNAVIGPAKLKSILNLCHVNQ